jgi:hypothetical protein
MRRIITWIGNFTAAIALVAITRAGVAKELERWFSFAAYPAARPLCDEHVAGSSMHISWRSFASRDPVERVVAFYERDQGAKATEQSPGAFVLHARARPDDVLEVRGTGGAGTYPSCSVRPAKGEKTVVIVSSATR